MSERDITRRFYRGSFASIGFDDRIYTVEARLDSEGKVILTLEDGRLLARLAKGSYVTKTGSRLHLECDHPDAP